MKKNGNGLFENLKMKKIGKNDNNKLIMEMKFR